MSHFFNKEDYLENLKDYDNGYNEYYNFGKSLLDSTPFVQFRSSKLYIVLKRQAFLKI